jgi:sucrose-6-phosphate hydrolase SacC (GH32 family)
VGRIDERTLRFECDPLFKPRKVDFGNFYASKSFWDEVRGIQVLWGWIDEEDGAGRARGWQGALGVPRQVLLDTRAHLLRTPPLEALSALRLEAPRESNAAPNDSLAPGTLYRLPRPSPQREIVLHASISHVRAYPVLWTSLRALGQTPTYALHAA